ncbi:MAG: hypothetical protein K8T10_16840 [Candidatus Eremiobacteraeota bacterium]|nr:hypothetical protein [Candidatus Eremiobacteraeota bacterium]
MSLYLIDKKLAELGLQMAEKDDEAIIVLIQDGVYSDVSSISNSKRVFLVESDVEKRKIENIPENTKTISYNDLIDLIEKEKVLSFI